MGAGRASKKLWRVTNTQEEFGPVHRPPASYQLENTAIPYKDNILDTRNSHRLAEKGSLVPKYVDQLEQGCSMTRYCSSGSVVHLKQSLCFSDLSLPLKGKYSRAFALRAEGREKWTCEWGWALRRKGLHSVGYAAQSSGSL